MQLGRATKSPMQVKTDVQEEESVSTGVRRTQILKLVTRKLGVLPSDPTARMTILKEQERSIIHGLHIMEGGGTTYKWEPLRAPKLYGAGEETRNAAQAALITLRRTTAGDIKSLDFNNLDRAQREREAANGTRGRINNKLLVVGIWWENREEKPDSHT